MEAICLYKKCRRDFPIFIFDAKIMTPPRRGGRDLLRQIIKLWAFGRAYKYYYKLYLEFMGFARKLPPRPPGGGYLCTMKI